MTHPSPISMTHGTAFLVGGLLLSAGAGAAIVTLRWTSPKAATPTNSVAAPTRTAASADVVALSADAMAAAGIVVAPAKTGHVQQALRLPATVEPNAYR